MREERIRVLLQIDELNKERCDKCIHTDAKGIRCVCAAAKDVRLLGEELLKLAKPRNQQEYKLLEILKFKDITGDHYWQLKAAEISDRLMWEQLGITESIFFKWKKENGLVLRKGVGV